MQAPTGELTLHCRRCSASSRPIIRAAGPQGVALHCRFCGSRTVVQPEPERAPVRVADGCPKCGVPRAERACPKCGLIYARWKGPAQARTDVDDATAKLWLEVQYRFDQPAMHEKFLAHCLHSGALAYAAARYAEEEANPDLERAAIAEIRRRQIRVLAESAYLKQSSRNEESRVLARTVRRATLFGATIALVCLVVWMGQVIARPRLIRHAQASHRAPATARLP